MLKILSWNIRQGGGSRVLPIVQNIIKSSAHIVILSEYKNNAVGDKICEYLRQGGYLYQCKTQAPSSDNTVFIASKMPHESIELYPDSDPKYGQNMITVHYEIFSVCGVYLPHKKPHVLFNTLHTFSKSESPFIIAGDFNTGINFLDQIGNSFMYENDFKKLINHSFVDAFRYVHGDVKEYSWYSHQGNGFRYDHTVVDNRLAPIIKNCYFDHTWREDKISDHSPMFLEIG